MPTKKQISHVPFSYWYSALGLLVTEMKSGANASTVASAGGKADVSSGGARNSRNGGTLVAASLGGAKRCASLSVRGVVWCLFVEVSVGQQDSNTPKYMAKQRETA